MKKATAFDDFLYERCVAHVAEAVRKAMDYRTDLRPIIKAAKDEFYGVGGDGVSPHVQEAIDLWNRKSPNDKIASYILTPMVSTGPMGPEREGLLRATRLSPDTDSPCDDDY